MPHDVAGSQKQLWQKWNSWVKIEKYNSFCKVFTRGRIQVGVKKCPPNQIAGQRGIVLLRKEENKQKSYLLTEIFVVMVEKRF